MGTDNIPFGVFLIMSKQETYANNVENEPFIFEMATKLDLYKKVLRVGGWL